MFYDRFKQLCAERGIAPTKASFEIGFSKGNVSYWKKKYIQGLDTKPDSYTASKIADFFGVSVDYLLGRIDEPKNSRSEIPQVYIDAAGGDIKKARALMLANERDKERKAHHQANKPSQFSEQDEELIFALWGDNTQDIDKQDLEDVKRFAAFIQERKAIK